MWDNAKLHLAVLVLHEVSETLKGLSNALPLCQLSFLGGSKSSLRETELALIREFEPACFNGVFNTAVHVLGSHSVSRLKNPVIVWLENVSRPHSEVTHEFAQDLNCIFFGGW